MAKRDSNRNLSFPLAWLGILGGLFIVLRTLLPVAPPRPAAEEDAGDAVRLMTRALDALREARAAAGLAIDERTDLNLTGLIGREASPTTTSLGHLEAKRTAANPALAGAVVRMLHEAGVGRGDAIAVGASSSFPGLVVATLCAAQAMGARALPIVSLGASNWGANDPRWTGLDIVESLNKSGVLDVPIIAASIGGEGDMGLDMAPEGRALLRRRIEEWGGEFLAAGDLTAEVAVRIRLFESWAAGAPIKAFVNVGGSWVDMGTDSEVLKLRPGFNPAADVSIPPVARRGLIQAWAAKGVPVVHLLFVRGLCERYGIPWDPMPFASPASAEASGGGRTSRLKAALAGFFVVVSVAGLIWIGRRRRIG
ncbi:MAG: poly-gamma-glutamate system protein [Candidatus Aminicenantes bacterium]|nr:poly-gamma-glutamate system protein [Candidatus Aminicenantes bacterium]